LKGVWNPGDDQKRPENGGKGFAFAQGVDLYSPREIALATGVPEAAVRAALGARLRGGYVEAADAVHIGRLLAAHARAKAAAAPPDAIFQAVAGRDAERHPLAALAASGTIHAVLAAIVVFVAGWNFAPHAAALTRADPPSELMRLVFLATPGPGGGGGGGGLRQPAPPPKAMREGTHRISSPVPRTEQKPIEPPPEPKPAPLQAERLPVLVAPIVSAPADPKDRIGVLEQTPAPAESQGPGTGGGAGTGAGSGLGSGDGSGVGPGSGGGTGGGPYRPGSGIQPPRLLKEVKADYTEQARQRGLKGEVVLEIVVRRDGSVGDVKILRGLGSGLDERAVQAVRQWKFAPAQRQGSPVDVIVEVAVEFTLR
jgi:periplasmic protein TonB